MAKGMLSLTAALLLSAMCAVEGQSAASGAAAAGGGGGGATAAVAAVGGGYDGTRYGGPRYGGGGYGGGGYGGYGGYGNGYRPQYAYNPVPNTYLPPGGRVSSSYVNAAKKIKSASGVGIFDNLLNHLIDAKLLNNNNG